MATDLYIIAAGKGSRMNSNLPKALVPIVDEPCLTTTLKQIGHKFKHVFIVTNALIQSEWTTYFRKVHEMYPSLLSNVTNLPIVSGLGDGHAVLWGFAKARNEIEPRSAKMNCILNDDVVIAWGDVFFPDARIIDELLEQPLNCSGIIPAVREENPYVTLLVDNHMQCLSADFSKYGENHPSGFHDQSVFRFRRSVIWDALSTLHDSFWKNGRYITQGGELSTLYAFHYLYNSEHPTLVYETDYPTLSFNTAEEVVAIQQEINAKWKSAQS